MWQGVTCRIKRSEKRALGNRNMRKTRLQRPQHLTEKSHEDEATPIPEGATLIWVILFSWPQRLPKWSLLIKSHIWMLESSLLQNNKRPETETPVEVKLELGVGGLYMTTSWSDLMSHSLEVLSSEQVTKLFPLGWKEREFTSASWPQKVCWQASVRRSHKRMVRSTEPVRKTSLSWGLRLRAAMSPLWPSKALICFLVFKSHCIIFISPEPESNSERYVRKIPLLDSFVFSYYIS